MTLHTLAGTAVLLSLVFVSLAEAQIGRRFPSERRVVPDPVTGVPLTFLTSSPAGDNVLYQTHQGWTADGKWIVFRSPDRAGDQGPQAFAVNEESGVIVQLTEGAGNNFGSGSLNVAQKSMKLYYTRSTTPGLGGRGQGAGGPMGVYELDLARLFADSAAGTMKPRTTYERLCGQLPAGMTSGGGFGLDANEQIAYLGVRGGDVGQRLPAGTALATAYGPRNMGAGPSGIRAMDLKTGVVSFVIDVPIQIGHLQANPFNAGEIIYCWETGGKAPTRAWVVNADGTGNRPVFPEAEADWVTHETVVSKDEVAIAILGHRKVGTTDQWGIAGTRERPTGVAVVNLRTREMLIEGQTPTGSVWHINGSYDGRWLVGDDFQRNIWLWDRASAQRNLLSTSHRTTAADHPHPIFNPAGTKVLVQSAMIATDQRAHDLCVIPIPKAWLSRTYGTKAPK